MTDREHGQGRRHRRVPLREVPGHGRAPVMAGDVRALASERFDEAADVLGEVIHGVALDAIGRICHSVAAKIRSDGKASGFRHGAHLFRPRLCTFRKSVQEDEQRSGWRPINQRPETEAVGLNHVLAGSHLMLWIKSTATSSAWSSTFNSPWPWPLKTSSRACGASFTASRSRSRRAKGSRSPLMK